jgi:inward rectifier potassium channel
MSEEALNLPQEEPQDLGFGSKVSRRLRLRLLNPDGTFNVRREGVSPLESLSLYHALVTMAWPKFYLSILALYFTLNTFFAFGYMLFGPESLNGAEGITRLGRFQDAFFFSVHTFTAVGYGHLTPNGLGPNLLVTAETFVGLVGFAIAAGLLIARFSRPTAKIRFSKVAVIAPYREGIPGFEFRIVNVRRNQLLEVQARVIFSWMEVENGRTLRRFSELKLERSKVTFLPLHWVIVHPIDESSPLKGFTHEDLEKCHAEFLINITAIDDTYSQSVHARSSYIYEEIVWGARFADLFQYSDGGLVSADLQRLSDVEQAGELVDP